MLDMSVAALEAIQRSYTMEIRAESWLDDQLLGEVPVDSGSETGDRSLAIPERVSLTVPRVDRGVSWDPVGRDHPLGSDGQRLRISIGIGLGNGETEWIERGWFLTTESATEDDTVSVSCQGLLTLIDEAKFISAFEPTGTFVSTLRALVEPALTVDIDGALVDRPVPVGLQWDEDRLGGLKELLDAWPAEAKVNENGVLAVTPPQTVFTSVAAITDDPKTGTVVKWQGGRSRDGGFNVVVARGEDVFGSQIQGYAFDTDADSPQRYGGPFNPLPVPFVFESPLLTTQAQCYAAAANILERKRRNSARKLGATMVPHPGVVSGDVVTITGPEGITNTLGTVEQFTLPYTPSEMSLSVVTF